MGEPQQEAQTIGELSRQISALRKELFGNGQPGILKDMENRITDQEKFRYKEIGALGVIGMAIQFFLHRIFH